MESVIREGALRLLTAEASCDVILNCQGHRLMAHKLILSMASPFFRGLLLEDFPEPTVVILPDINGSIMSLILDYIYTGSVIVYSNTIQDFVGVASLLKIHLDINYPEGVLPDQHKIFHDSGKTVKFDDGIVKKKEEIHYQEKVESLDVVSDSNPEVYSKKNQRKLPNLVPISRLQTREKLRSPRKLCSYVLPSPWCPRVERVFGDPRNDCLEIRDSQICSLTQPTKVGENDTNNNFQLQPIHLASRYRTPNKLNDTLSKIYQKASQKVISLKENHTTGRKISSEPFASENRSISCKEISKNLDIDLTNTKEKSVDHSRILPSINNLQLHPEIQYNKIGTVFQQKESVSSKTTSNDSIKETTGDNNSNNSSDSVDKEIDKTEEDSKFEQKKGKLKPFKCEDCGKSFSQLRNYKYHRSVHEGTKEFAAKCPECGKVFNDRGYLSSHMKIHRDKKEYACPHCPKRFNQRVAYNMHLRIHTGIKPHECSVCGKSFSRKMLLKQHQRVHTGERPYSCPECGKTFADRSNMSLHARLHTGVKPYACNLCPKSFTKKHHLKTHMNFHTGLKPYACEKCGLTFSQSSNMRTHYKKCILKDISLTSTPSEVQIDSS